MSGPLGRRNTKIVATLGPASSSPASIEELIVAGVNVVRLNLSHGTRAEHGRVIGSVREVSARLEVPVAILLDLQGPRIRTGRLKGGQMELKPRQQVTITAGEPDSEAPVITTTYDNLHRDVAPGDRILMDDGLIEVRVRRVVDTEIGCEVVYGGVLREHKGMNLPGVNVSAPSLSDKDREDLDFGIDNGVDFIALSFVRKASDIFELRERLKQRNAEIPIIAKIEKAEAIENLDAILDESEGIMIARGDLGVELSAEVIPVLQKKLISRANEAGKVVITATQMLESMIANP
ncbi:MAG TPA: pyruvate kinase, partial [Thermodesulfobacteriota bacterium]|nr:pyruvate kinase [Thermodesulfobacteriota bacterium]